MKNYIKTKDGIYYVGDLVKDEYGNYCHNVDDKTCEVPAKGIIKEADTPEELCDLFVYTEARDVLDKFFFYDKQSDSFVSIYDYEFCLERDSEITKFLKGAIFTDKGLIYVTQMDKEGRAKLC